MPIPRIDQRASGGLDHVTEESDVATTSVVTGWVIGITRNE
jgi:hypothetical protein